jgi:hypothetical protein
MGYSKGTLHELKAKARADEPFKVYAPVKTKIAVAYQSGAGIGNESG